MSNGEEEEQVYLSVVEVADMLRRTPKANRLAERFGICRVVHLCIHVGLHVCRRHEPDPMAQFRDRAST